MFPDKTDPRLLVAIRALEPFAGSEAAARALVGVALERGRQQAVEGFDAAHDAAHPKGDLAFAAICYADPTPRAQGRLPLLWPWDAAWWKPKTRERDLERAAALLVAELERVTRQPATTQEQSHG